MTELPRRSRDVTQLELLTAIRGVEVSTTAAIAKLGEGLDQRLRAIENAAPSTLGPRLQALERWRDVGDGTVPGGLPKRVENLEDLVLEMRGTVKTLRFFAGAVSTAVALMTLWMIVRGGL